MQNILTKRNVLIGSGILAGIFSISLISIFYGLCGEFSRDCKNIFGVFGQFLFPFPPLFLFSLITYKMREEVYQAWFRFARWWIPLSVILILITPSESGTWAVPSLLDKGMTAFLFSALFALISPLIIIYTHLKYYCLDHQKSFRALSAALIVLSTIIVFAPLYWLLHGLF